MLKKISIRIGLLLLSIAALNVIYTFTLYPQDLAEKSKEILEICNTQDSTDVYYFGESSNVTYRKTDSIKSSISDLASTFYPALRFTTINKFATHAGIYKNWLKVMDVRKKMPQAIIVTLNLRSFDAAWIHSNLETQLQEALVFTRPLPNIVNRFLLSLQAFDNKTDEQREQDMLLEWKSTPLEFPYSFNYKTVSEWDSKMAAGGYLKEDGSWDEKKIVLACHYIKSYAFNIHENNVRLKDFDEIKNWCTKMKVKLYLNLLAENIEFADSLVGKDLVFLMRENRDFIVNRYNGDNCIVIDNLENVAGNEFIDSDWTTEHYGYRGRMTIARNIADSLRKQFNNNYKKAY